MRKLAATHIANLVLSFIAFGFFVANQAVTLTGGRLDLHGQLGGYLLAGFLAAGVIVQFAKFIEGHRHWSEVVFTWLMIIVHVIAEMYIWNQTQIVGTELPEQIPLYIVGMYWLFGAVDILVMYAPRELALFRGESEWDKSEREKADLQKRLQEREIELALAQQSRTYAERDAQRAASQRALPAGPAKRSVPSETKLPKEERRAIGRKLLEQTPGISGTEFVNALRAALNEHNSSVGDSTAYEDFSELRRVLLQSAPTNGNGHH